MLTFTRLSTSLVCAAIAGSLLGCDPGVSGRSALDGPVAYRVGEFPLPVSDADYQYDGAPPETQVELGRLLFFDKILSGTDDIACATCHHPFAGTGDGLSLGLGHTAQFLSVMRVALPGNRSRIVRNATHLFNLGWRGVTTLTWDGDVSLDPTQPSGFSTPAGAALPLGLHDILAAQNMFPTNQPREMSGSNPNNPISAAAVALDNTTAWALYAAKVAAVPAYVSLFQATFEDVDDAEDITFVHIANALSAFQISAFRSDNAPFDRYMRGDTDALSPSQVAGMDLFYGDANCSTCHSGPFQSDMSFHAISIPQFGPGRATGVDGRDLGRRRVSRVLADSYRYKTPMLRNVALTAPYGHDGAYPTLEGIVRHHLDAVNAMNAWDPALAILPPNPSSTLDDFAIFNDPVDRAARAAANEIEPIALLDEEVAQLVDFLHALTDPKFIDMRTLIPREVPSGLPVAD